MAISGRSLEIIVFLANFDPAILSSLHDLSPVDVAFAVSASIIRICPGWADMSLLSERDGSGNLATQTERKSSIEIVDVTELVAAYKTAQFKPFTRFSGCSGYPFFERG